jgi:hypothetical protein
MRGQEWLDQASMLFPAPVIVPHEGSGGIWLAIADANKLK